MWNKYVLKAVYSQNNKTGALKERKFANILQIEKNNDHEKKKNLRFLSCVWGDLTNGPQGSGLVNSVVL